MSNKFESQQPKKHEEQAENPAEVLVNGAQEATLEFIRASYPRNSREPVVIVGYNPVSWDEHGNATAVSGILVRDEGTNTDIVIEEDGSYWTSFMTTSMGGMTFDYKNDPGAYLY